MISTPLIGATDVNVWKPPSGVTPGTAGDATAPFALGTMAFGIFGGPPGSGKVAQFARAAGAIAAGATTGITAGVTVAAGSGNTWTNNTGAALVTGDYAFFEANAPTA